MPCSSVLTPYNLQFTKSVIIFNAVNFHVNSSYIFAAHFSWQPITEWLYNASHARLVGHAGHVVLRLVGQDCK